MSDTETHSRWTREAYELGKEHGRNAGSWAADGNTTEEHIRSVLRMMADGDPQADDYLPAYPNLSGEWADNPTPRSLFTDITGLDAHAETTRDLLYAYNDCVDELAQAYEAGVSATFYDACESALRGFLPDGDAS